MNDVREYLIPKNTPILWRNVDRELKLKRHVTERPLHFAETKCTGDGGLTYYFELDDWLIVVDAELVVHNASLDTGIFPEAAQRSQPSILCDHAPSLHGSMSSDLALGNLPMLRVDRA